MTSLRIPLDDASMVLSNDHTFGLDYSTTEPSPNFPFDPDLTISKSSNIVIDKPPNSTIELQVGVPCEFDVSHRHLDTPNDEFLPIGYVIDVDIHLPLKPWAS